MTTGEAGPVQGSGAPRICIVSACLLGRACRYDGASKPSSAVEGLVADWERAGDRVVAVCPEELGDLGTPRPAAELRGGDGHAVLAGRARVEVVGSGPAGDVTEAFVQGARRALGLAPGATVAVLKARSPSCGCGQTVVDGRLAPGDGVFAALLRQNGCQVFPFAHGHTGPALCRPRLPTAS